MRCKTLTAAAVVMLMMTAGCSTLERVVYRPDINQGITVANDVSKIHTGMTQQQVAYARYADDATRLAATSGITCSVRSRAMSVKQQTLTLTFDSNGTLTNIDNKPRLTGTEDW